jgi:GAF domain-containing protein
LFGDFIEREGIQSSVRLLHKANGSIEAVLFVNFAETREFDDSLKDSLRDLLMELVRNLPTLCDELRKSETNTIVQAIRILPPTPVDLLSQLSEWDASLENYFHSLLKVVIQALEIESGTAFGTIHLYDRKTETLRPVAYFGEKTQEAQSTQPLSILTGEGIISWVAIRRKALLITDLENSEFKKIHFRINEGARSEVAIPMMAGEELIGVLNLEAFRPNFFQPSCVRSLWFAANRAAMEYSLSQQARLNSRLKDLGDGLLELCGQAVGEGTGNFSLDKLALLAATQLEATRCDIWHYDKDSNKFELAGISNSECTPAPPRLNGWSKHIRRSRQPVWINEIKADTEFKICYWNEGAWDQKPQDLDTPSSINSSVAEQGVGSLLGIPIEVRGQCIGVAWLEYDNTTEIPPQNGIMRVASGFAAHAGLVIEFSQVDLVDKEAVQRIGNQLSENLLAQGELSLQGFPWIEGYVKSKPFADSRIGGDFYFARVIDEQTVGVLVGDGQGHAVTGALNMLPMLTVFEVFWKESRSATHIMDKIMSISNKLRVRGTAIYCVFTLIQQRMWLSVTSAAHPYLVIFREGGRVDLFPDKDSPAMGGMLGVPLNIPPNEDRVQLYSGDLIIIFTDGLDMESDEIATVGLEHKRAPLKTIAEAVFSKAAQMRGGESPTDDATVLVLRVK